MLLYTFFLKSQDLLCMVEAVFELFILTILNKALFINWQTKKCRTSVPNTRILSPIKEVRTKAGERILFTSDFFLVDKIHCFPSPSSSGLSDSTSILVLLGPHKHDTTMSSGSNRKPLFQPCFNGTQKFIFFLYYLNTKLN